MIIEIEGKRLDVDIEKTKEYYTANSLCDCVGCRNYYVQIAERYPKLCAFLGKLGVELSKPDEIVWGDELDGELDYIVVYYTVNGKILETDGYELDISDSTFVNISFDKADNSSVPCKQKTDEYFVLSVFGIVLPYIIDEPFLTEDETAMRQGVVFSRKKRFLDLFRKKWAFLKSSLSQLVKKLKNEFFDKLNPPSILTRQNTASPKKPLIFKGFFVAVYQIRGGSCPLELPRGLKGRTFALLF